MTTTEVGSHHGEAERERKTRYIQHTMEEAPRILQAHSGSMEKSELREILRSSFGEELPIEEANAYGWGFRRLTEAGVIEPASGSTHYTLCESQWRPLPTAESKERERKTRYIQHIINEAPRILLAHGGSMKKSDLREALRRSYTKDLPFDEANSYGWGFRRLTEAGIIEPSNRSTHYMLRDE